MRILLTILVLFGFELTSVQLGQASARAHSERTPSDDRSETMGMSDNFPLLTLQRTASGAIAARRILCTTANDGELAQAGSGAAKLIAIAGAVGAASGGGIEAHYEGIVPVEYGDDVVPGDELTADAQGRAVPAGPGDHVIGRANEAGGLGTIGSVVMAPAVVEPANAAIQAHLTSTSTRVAHVPLPAFTLSDGTPLAAFADGDSVTPGLSVDDGEAPGVRWNDHATPAAIHGKVDLPADLDDGEDIVVNIVASKTGATLGDATTFDVGAFLPVVGGLRDADANAGGATGAMVGNAASKTLQKVTRTIAAADIPAGAAYLALSLKPTNGTLGTDDVTVHSVYLEYTPKLLGA